MLFADDRCWNSYVDVVAGTSPCEKGGPGGLEGAGALLGSTPAVTLAGAHPANGNFFFAVKGPADIA